MQRYIALCGLLLGWMSGSAAAAVGSVPSAASNPPRYKLVPGLELNYRSNWSIKYWKADKSSRKDEQIDVTLSVIRGNADGSDRLIIRQNDVSTLTITGKQRREQRCSDISYADAFPDGRIVPSPAIEVATVPAVLFPPLPKDAAEATSGWEATEQLFRFSCRRESSASNWVFSAMLETPFNKTYLEKHTARYTLDVSLGLLRGLDESINRDSGIHEDGIGMTELISVRTIEPEKLRQIASDADGYFPAVENYDAQLKVAARASPEDAAKIADEAETKLKRATDRLRMAVFKDAAADLLKGHEARARNVVEKARVNPIGKPAPSFEATDIDGRRVRLVDLRGKVVVLDFWYRGCAWCVASMPQLNQLAADFTGSPVAILGMNTDSDPADARFVIDKMKLKYPTLKAETLAHTFDVDEFPTLLLIDQHGVIRDVHVGYSANLRRDLGLQIRKLLSEK